MTNSEEKWNDLCEQIPIDTATDDGHRRKLRKEAMQAFDNSPIGPAESRYTRPGRRLMRNRWLQLTIAGVIVAVLAWILPSGGTPAFALEQLVNKIVNARTARWEMEVELAGEETQVIKVSVVPGRCRQDFESMTTIIDWNAGRVLTLMKDSKRAVVMQTSKNEASSMHINQFEIIRDGLQAAMADADQKVESLGERTVDGRKLLGFRFLAKSRQIDVWADPEKEIPVEIVIPLQGAATQVVMKNYEFNIDLDESLFRTEVPAGYTVLDSELIRVPDEADLITSLRMGCECSDGEFPASLSPEGIGEVTQRFISKLIEDADKSPANGQLSNEQLQQVAMFGRGFSFATAQSINRESGACYAGNGVKLNSSAQPVFWYKPPAAENYRVICADLSVKEFATAPQVDGAVKLAF